LLSTLSPVGYPSRPKTRYEAPGWGLPRQNFHPLGFISFSWRTSSRVKVCIVADRGFGDQKLYRMLTEELKFGYVIRFRGNITVTTTAGETRTAAASSADATSKELMSLYGKRWGIECGLRDAKDPRFGMGMGSIHISMPERRDRLWLLHAFAIALLTLLGAAGEALGYDRYLKSNTTKRRTHSLFRQGCMLYELIPISPT
jgi:Transposase DDE domain